MLYVRDQQICKGLYSKYFQLFRPYALCCSHLVLPLSCENSYRQYVNKWMWLCSNKNLFTKTGSRINFAPFNLCNNPMKYLLVQLD